MRPELQAYLDGELRLDELPAELRAEAGRWDRFARDLGSLGPHTAPPELEGRIARALAEQPKRIVWGRAVNWAVRPRPVRISPLAGLAAAAVLALIVVRPWSSAPPERSRPEASVQTMVVQFVLEAPGARSVAVAGDFNGWTPSLILEDADGDGIWTGRVPLQPGVHEYMFVIDGSEWMTDPRAERYNDDGFGNRNAVLVLTPHTSQS